jgi:hypothetical protein
MRFRKGSANNGIAACDNRFLSENVAFPAAFSVYEGGLQSPQLNTQHRNA